MGAAAAWAAFVSPPTLVNAAKSSGGSSTSKKESTAVIPSASASKSIIQLKHMMRIVSLESGHGAEVMLDDDEIRSLLSHGVYL